MPVHEHFGYLIEVHDEPGEVSRMVAEVRFGNLVVWKSEPKQGGAAALAEAKKAIDGWLAAGNLGVGDAKILARQALKLGNVWKEQGPLSFEVERELEKLLRLANATMALPLPETPDKSPSIRAGDPKHAGK